MSSPALDNRAIAVIARMLRDHRGGALRPVAEYVTGDPDLDPRLVQQYLSISGAAGARGAERGSGGAGSRLGPYELVRELGRGAQGVVWLARDERLSREVALKVVADPLGGAGSAPRLRREALAAAALNHPAICPVYEVGASDGASWIAMRHVEGRTLDALELDVARDWRDVLLLFEELGEALATAHAAGIVHRDVKPSNVLVTPDGRPTLLDFGVAALADDGAALTSTGTAMGTPAYMAPEQLLGRRGEIDGRADVWGLAVTLYERLAGRRPFEAPTHAGLARAILEAVPPPLHGLRPELPTDLSVVVATALDRDLARRYADMRTFVQELGRARRGEPVLARPVGTLGRLARWVRREPRFAASVAVLTATLLVALLGLWGSLRRTQSTLDERNALLEEIGRTSDHLQVRDLLHAEPGLWPALPARLADLRGWLDGCDAALARRAEHGERRARVARRASAPEQGPDRARDRWLLGQLDELLAGLVELEAARARVAPRATLAAHAAERLVGEDAAAWRTARAALQGDARFEGVELAPIAGLVPLGADPASGLQEFAHLLSGEPAVRGPDGRLVLAPSTGLVLVLVPGGRARVGALLPTDEHPPGAPFVDPAANAVHEVGLREVALAPFLMSKYEVTQAQWTRQAGENPAYYTFGDDPERNALRAVEQVSWEDCARVLAQWDLSLPDETRWEYAARAGSTGRWSTGDDPTVLRAHANLSDRTAEARWRDPQFIYEDWEDGWADPAPVGRFLPNAFGLHDVHGNVKEWTSSGWTWPEESSVPPPSDRAGSTAATCVVRGGSFGTPAALARLCLRRGYSRDARSYQVGVRPMRTLDAR